MADNESKDKPQPAPVGEAEAPFVDDIIVWTDGLDAPRQITAATLKSLPKLDSSLLPPINSLIKQGVTVAAIPTTSGIGAACYLVNLATLKKPSDPDK